MSEWQDIASAPLRMLSTDLWEVKGEWKKGTNLS